MTSPVPLPEVWRGAFLETVHSGHAAICDTAGLTVNKHLKAGSDDVEPDHPLQPAVREAFKDVTCQDRPGYGIDGCSASNFSTTNKRLNAPIHNRRGAVTGYLRSPYVS
jgi:L-asparaginase II